MIGTWLMLDKLAINFNNIAFMRLKGQVVYIVLLSGYIIVVTYSDEDKAQLDYDTYLEKTKTGSWNSYSFTNYKDWAILEKGNSILKDSILDDVAPELEE